MFKCCVFYFLGVSEKRLTIFKNRITSFGGNVVRNGKDASITHLIVDEDLLSNSIQFKIKMSQMCGTIRKEVSVLPVKWLTESLKAKKCVPCDEYRVSVGEEFDLVCSSRKRQMSAEELVETTAKETAPDIREKDYICSQSSSSKKIKLEKNEAVVAELRKLAETYRATKDTWRVYSYEKAISAISKYDKEITCYQEALAIPGVGEKMALKVMEVLETGCVRKVSELCESEEAKVLEMFCAIWGAGPSTAAAWYRSGYRNLADLSQAKLTQQQQIGIRLFDDFNQKIPRAEVEKLGEVVKMAAHKVDSRLSAMLVGSYRRGRESSGDVDVMIVNPVSHSCTQVLLDVLVNLKENGIVTDDLTVVEESRQQRKWLGVARLNQNSLHRRLDLFVVPTEEKAAALVHFTGSALFNRSIRQLAAKKGMCLSEHGLYSDTIRRSNEIVDEGTLIPTASEEEIFTLLGLEYRPPEERDH